MQGSITSRTDTTHEQQPKTAANQKGGPMQSKRTRRAAIGTACIAIVALAMGWFVGQYIPGTPHAPESELHSNMYDGIGYPAQETLEYEFGQNASLENIKQGEKYYSEAGNGTLAFIGETNEEIDEKSYIEYLKHMDQWEHTYPALELGIAEARFMSLRSFVDWYPSFQGRGYIVDDCTIALVALSITNTSDELISGYINFRSGGAIPEGRLWTEGLALCDDSLGSGIVYDPEAFSYVNEPVPVDPTLSREQNAEYIYLQPAETQEILLPYVIPRNSLEDPERFAELKASDFCIRIPDFGSNTEYRLWLG